MGVGHLEAMQAMLQSIMLCVRLLVGSPGPGNRFGNASLAPNVLP